MIKDKDNNIIFVGEKPLINYVFAVQTQFRKSDEVIIKSRGKFISRAVDLAESITKKFMGEEKIKIDRIITNSANFKNKDNREVTVSEIEITLKR